MHLQVLPQIIPLLWQMVNHKHFVYIPELQICYTIIIVNLNMKKSHSLLDDPRMCGRKY